MSGLESPDHGQQQLSPLGVQVLEASDSALRAGGLVSPEGVSGVVAEMPGGLTFSSDGERRYKHRVHLSCVEMRYDSESQITGTMQKIPAPAETDKANKSRR